MEELFNKYMLPNLIVIEAEDSIDGEAIYVSDLEDIKKQFKRDLQAYGEEFSRNVDNAIVKDARKRVNDAHRDGYVAGVYDFQNYFMDASIPAQRHPIGMGIAEELIKNYKPRISVKGLKF